MESRGLFATFGASSGFSGVAFVEFIKIPTVAGALAFLGSVASTLISFELARRSENRRADYERQRELRELERAREYVGLFKGSLSPDQLRELLSRDVAPPGSGRA